MSYASIIVLTLFTTLAIYGIVSSGPIMTTYSGTLKCDQENEVDLALCKYKKHNTLIAGVFFTILTFLGFWAYSFHKSNQLSRR